MCSPFELLAIGSKDENIVDQVDQKPSITSSQKEQKQKEAPKISYASMVSRTFDSHASYIKNHKTFLKFS